MIIDMIHNGARNEVAEMLLIRQMASRIVPGIIANEIKKKRNHVVRTWTPAEWQKHKKEQQK